MNKYDRRTVRDTFIGGILGLVGSGAIIVGFVTINASLVATGMISCSGAVATRVKMIFQNPEGTREYEILTNYERLADNPEQLEDYLQQLSDEELEDLYSNLS